MYINKKEKREFDILKEAKIFSNLNTTELPGIVKLFPLPYNMDGIF